jgi:hypothetical protein
MFVSHDYVYKRLLTNILDIMKAAVPKSMQNPELKKFVVEL